MISARCEDVIEVARKLGLDLFDIRFEEVPMEIMNEIAAYGLPIRAQHWSYGKVYDRFQIHGRMGLSKIYEIVLNSDPAYAFMLDTNTELENLLIAAHVAAHADFFKNNTYFEHTNRNMINEAAEHAVRIDRYKQTYGVEAVEQMMDRAFAVDRHIDDHKGLHRAPYPGRKVVERRRTPAEYGDLYPDEDQPFSLVRETVGGKVPPRPERDLLWFLANYAPLEDWERDLVEMIREEAYYFYPQFITKILNEGWASYWHAEIIHHYEGIRPDEMIDFSRLHAAVVRPGGARQVNPYYLGYRLLVDIEQRWDRRCRDGRSSLDGRAKIFRIRSEENDISFLRNYLTRELAEELNLYAYGPACGHITGDGERCPRCGKTAVKSRKLDDIKEELLRPRYHYGVPCVLVTEVRHGTLHLEHRDTENGGLDRTYAEPTLKYLSELWQGPVTITTVNTRGTPVEMRHDDAGFGMANIKDTT